MNHIRRAEIKFVYASITVMCTIKLYKHKLKILQLHNFVVNYIRDMVCISICPFESSFIGNTIF